MLYIRHAEKEHRNGANGLYRLDPALTAKGEQAAARFFEQLLQKEPVPPRLVSSPYRRAWATAVIAQRVIMDQTGILVPVTVDPLLGEYLGHQKDIKPEYFHPDTLAHQPPQEKVWKQYVARMKKHRKRRQPGWHITHGIILVSMAYLNGDHLDYPYYLGYYREW